jgi:peptidoglycan/LPS O-acetylase OafA/YrhL
MLVPAIDHWKGWPTRGGAAIAYLSAVSYALYLVNLGLIARPMRRVLSEWEISGGMGWYVLYLLIAIGAAAALHELVEKPVSRMRTQWAKRPS